MIRPTCPAAAAAALLLASLTCPGLVAAQTTPTAAPAILPAATQTDPAARPGPCPFTEIDIDKFGRQPFQNPPDLRAVGGSLASDLVVQYTDPKTTSIAGCPVTLRTYNGQLVGPTLRIKPGDTLDLAFKNRLPVESPDQVAHQVHQQMAQAHLGTSPHSYNTTNLHTHGLHVSPTGNSDNVLLAIPPQSQFPYEIRVPLNHPPGSFWYHAHTHGSTAIQVGSGMSGALIIEDDPATIPPALRAANAREKVFVIQTILYDTHGRADDIAAFFPDSAATQVLCDQGKSGCTWQNSKRRITVNGQIVPVIRMQPGEVQRWRFIDTSFRESLNIRLQDHSLHEIALDGLYLGKIDTWGPAQTVELQPGYRSDVLVQASLKKGTYRLVDGASGAGISLRGVAEDENLLAEIVIDGEPLDMQLPTDAEMAPLAPFPGVDLTKQAIGVQQVVFKLGADVNPDTAKQLNYFQVNYQAFNPNLARKVKLNNIDLWSVSTVGDPYPNGIPPLPHVFHIHVNPFQVARTNPAGQSETVWRDTVLIPAGATVDLYTQYLDFIGQFVMHCHILDHEDLGMMEIVEVVGEAPLPQGHGGHH